MRKDDPDKPRSPPWRHDGPKVGLAPYPEVQPHPFIDPVPTPPTSTYSETTRPGAKDHETMVEPMRPEGAANEPARKPDSAAPAPEVSLYVARLELARADQLDRIAAAENFLAGIDLALEIARQVWPSPTPPSIKPVY